MWSDEPPASFAPPEVNVPHFILFFMYLKYIFVYHVYFMDTVAMVLNSDRNRPC